MDLDRNDDLGTTRSNSEFEANRASNTTGLNPLSDNDSRVYDRDTGGSNFLAFLIGGLVIAVGLLAFLFYDGGNTRDVTTTGSLTPRVEHPATPTTPARPAPSNPQ